MLFEALTCSAQQRSWDHQALTAALCMLQSSQDSALTRTATIVIVGDEILSGKVQDANSSLLCRELHGLGWRVLRVSF